MSSRVIDQEKTQQGVSQILNNVNNIRSAAEAVNTLMESAYKKSNLAFLKELADKFSTDDKYEGIGADAAKLLGAAGQLNDALQAYFKEVKDFSEAGM